MKVPARMINLIVTIAVGYVFLVIAIYTFQRKIMYFPDRSVPDAELSGVPEMEAVTLATADGLELLSWYNAAETGQPTLVYLCGNAGNIGNRSSKVRPYLDAGMGVLLVSYRGYGGNPGSPSEEGLYADGRAAMGFLTSQDIPSQSVVIYGESLGSGIAVQLALEAAETAPVGGLVLEAPFASIADVAASHYPFLPVSWLVKDRFESAAKIGRVNTPVFVLHGERDRTVPTQSGRDLFAAAGEPKESLWVAGARHNDLYDFDVVGPVIAFIRRHVRAPGAG